MQSIPLQTLPTFKIHCLAHELSPQPHCLDFNSQKIIKNIAPPSKDHKRRAKEHFRPQTMAIKLCYTPQSD